MRHLVPIVVLLAAIAPEARADIPVDDPIGGGRKVLLVIAVAVAIGAAWLFAARSARRRSASADGAAATKRPGA